LVFITNHSSFSLCLGGSIYKVSITDLLVRNTFLWFVGGFLPTWHFISANDGALGLYDGGGSSFRLGLGSGSNQRLTIRTHHIPLEILEVVIGHRIDGGFVGVNQVCVISIYRQQIVSHISQDV